MLTINWKNATPEQLVLYQHLNHTFDITVIEPLYYQGIIAGSEFLVYDVAKIYLCLDITFTTSSGVNTVPANNSFLDENNLDFYYSNTPSLVDNVGVVNYCYNDATSKNLYFSRFTNAFPYLYVKFNGYRLTIA